MKFMSHIVMWDFFTSGAAECRREYFQKIYIVSDLFSSRTVDVFSLYQVIQFQLLNYFLLNYFFMLIFRIGDYTSQ